jgi:DNA primase
LYFTEEKIAEVREASDLLATVRQYVDLKRNSDSNYVGLCPFHSERTPSFTVNPDKGFFYCFGCQAGGDVITFLMNISSMSFVEAVTELAQRNGVSLPEPGRGGAFRPSPLSRQERDRLLAVTQRAQDIFHDKLWNSSHGLGVRNYLRRRGLDEETSRNFGLGYSLPDWQGLYRILIKDGFEPELILKAGLIKPRSGGYSGSGYYDAFRDRLMIPVMDADSRTVAFAGRIVDQREGSGIVLKKDVSKDAGSDKGSTGDESEEEKDKRPKYINSPLTPIYKKGALLYGYPQARPFLKIGGCVFVVEGYFDLIALVSQGLKNVVASMGTALTQSQVNMLRGKTSLIYLLFDGDGAGREAAKKALPKLLNAEIEGRAIILPPEHDPDSFVRERGIEALYELAENRSVSAQEYAAESLMGHHPDTLIGKAKALREIRDLLAEVKDSGKGQLLRNDLAERLGVDPDHIPLKGDAPPLRPIQRSVVPLGDHPSLNEITAKILFHALSHPETAIMLPELETYWPDDPTKPLFLELSSQAKEIGYADPQKLFKHDRDEFLETMISKAAVSGRSFDAEAAAAVAESYATRLKRLRALEVMNELTVLIKKAHKDGDQEEVKALSEKRNKVHLIIREGRSNPMVG